MISVTPTHSREQTSGNNGQRESHRERRRATRLRIKHFFWLLELIRTTIELLQQTYARTSKSFPRHDELKRLLCRVLTWGWGGVIHRSVPANKTHAHMGVNSSSSDQSTLPLGWKGIKGRQGQSREKGNIEN